MKRAVSLLLSAALLLGLMSACQRPSDAPASPSDAVARDWSAAELAETAFNASGYAFEEVPEAHGVQEDREWMEAYIENAYGLQETWLDAALLRAAGASAFEIAVLRMEDNESAVRAATVLMSYIFARQGDFAGYAPAEAEMVASGDVMQDGCFAALFVCPDSDGARRAVEAVLNGEDLSAPGGNLSGKTITDVKELRDLLVADRGMPAAELTMLDNGDPEALRAYIQEAYGLKPNQWEECAIAFDPEDSAFEVAVFRVSSDDWDKIMAVEGRLNDYLNDREAQFDSASDQAKLLHQAIAIQANPYVVLLACQDWGDAADAFYRASGIGGYGYSPRYRYLYTDPNYPDRCVFSAPNNDDMSIYDTTAIRTAWEQGDPSGLSEYDRKTYNAAEKVLKKTLKNGMSDYEKEVAIYSWVVNNVDYDWTHQNHMKTTPRESFTPYGGLVYHTAVCLGYASTFQLLMDLAGVECITVPGAAFSSQEDHGWNEVRLNGEWYCVDVTWDANYREQGATKGREEEWNFFNVTSDYMADTDHQWDYANIPEATAEDQGRG